MKLSNLIQMALILFEKRRCTANELANMLNVSTRTIYRYVNTLYDSNIPIYTDKGKGGGIYIREDFSPNNQILSIFNFDALISALKTLAVITSDKNYTNALKKVKHLTPINDIKLSNFKENKILIDINLNSFNFESYIFPKIKNAIDNLLIIKFNYNNIYDSISPEIAEPYRLILKESGWFLEAFCIKNDIFKIFKLSSISNLNVTNQTFDIRYLNYEITPLALWKNTGTCDVDLLTNTNGAKIINKFYGSSTTQKIAKDSFKATIPFSKTPQEYAFLFILKDSIKIISPKDVKDTFLATIKSILNVYESVN